MSHRRSEGDKKRLKKVAERTGGWPIGAWYSDRKNRYLRLYTSDWGRGGYVKWLKRYCNRRVRKHPELLQHNSYRRHTEFWWDLF